MTRTCWMLLVSAALGMGPAVACAAPPAGQNAVAGGSAAAEPVTVVCEGRYAYDAAAPWLHGYFQETPAYGGFHAFRPYNYKHVFVQSQLAAEWGASPTAPYSHQTGRSNSPAK